MSRQLDRADLTGGQFAQNWPLGSTQSQLADHVCRMSHLFHTDLTLIDCANGRSLGRKVSQYVLPIAAHCAPQLRASGIPSGQVCTKLTDSSGQIRSGRPNLEASFLTYGQTTNKRIRRTQKTRTCVAGHSQRCAFKFPVAR